MSFRCTPGVTTSSLDMALRSAYPNGEARETFHKSGTHGHQLQQELHHARASSAMGGWLVSLQRPRHASDAHSMCRPSRTSSRHLRSTMASVYCMLPSEAFILRGGLYASGTVAQRCLRMWSSGRAQTKANDSYQCRPSIPSLMSLPDNFIYSVP